MSHAKRLIWEKYNLTNNIIIVFTNIMLLQLVLGTKTVKVQKKMHLIQLIYKD